MLNYFEDKKQTFLTINNRIFQTPKTRILAKKCQIFLHLDLLKITLQIMLNYFEEKKETFFDYKNENFSKSKNHIFFQRN